MNLFQSDQSRKIAELEEANRQWAQWYAMQQLPQSLPPQIPTQTKKKKKKAPKNKVNPNPLSNEAKMWFFILLLTVFSILVIKDWLSEATQIKPPKGQRKEVRNE